MFQYYKNLSIATKLQIIVFIILFIFLSITLETIEKNFEDHSLKEVETKGINIAEGTLSGLNMMMLTGTIVERHNRKIYAEKISSSQNILDFYTFRGEGVDSQYGKGLEEEKPKTKIDREILKTGKVQSEYLTTTDGKEAIKVTVPFIASKNYQGTNCLDCHAVPEGSVLGGSSVTMDISESIQSIDNIMLYTWITMIAICKTT
ncbi:MAG: hypothetical protein OIF32_11210, partial [Campylobacterales bacterium]|nr:hypothetical protein [Campylobacterales bacterium]